MTKKEMQIEFSNLIEDAINNRMKYPMSYYQLKAIKIAELYYNPQLEKAKDTIECLNEEIIGFYEY